MTHPVETLPATMLVGDAIAAFTDPRAPLRHKSYPVVDENNVPVGMVSRTDILRWTQKGGWAEDARLGDSTGQVAVGYGDELVGELADRMAVRDLGRVPIVERQDGKLVGLVARRDLLRARARVRKDELHRSKLLRLRRRLKPAGK
jgi:CBS domain-containing protein